MNDNQKRQLIGLENLAIVYKFQAVELLEYLDSCWNKLNYEERQMPEGRSLYGARQFLNNSLEPMGKIANTELRIDIAGARV